jgi:hypothetical protein
MPKESRPMHEDRRMFLGVLLSVAGVPLLVSVAGTFGSDQPVIMVSRTTLMPPRIEVHVGELIRWQAPGGEHLHLSLDAHPGAHEAVVRSGEIRALFLLPGVHTYKVSVIGDGRRVLSGTVVVREAAAPVGRPPVCAPVSFKEVCFEP